MPGPQLHYDEDGNQYTAEELSQALTDMHADEDRPNTFGGQAANTPTTPGSSAPSTAERPASETPPKDNTAESSATKGMVPKEAAPPSPEKEPGDKGGRFSGSFGDIFRKNIFGGLDASYVTGKRPMTLWDYATDVLSAYGGQDLGARNARLVNQDIAKKKMGMEQQKLDLETQKSKSEATKMSMEAHKAFAAEIDDTFERYDQEQWIPHIQSLAKEAGIPVPKETIGMTQTLLDQLHAAGANATEVMENPDKYPPALVNRLRHTATLWATHVQNAHKTEAETKKSEEETAAGAIKREGAKAAKGLPGATPAQQAAIDLGGESQTTAMKQLLAPSGGKEYKSEFALRDAAAQDDPEAQARLKKFEATKTAGQSKAAEQKQAGATVAKLGFQLDSMERFFTHPMYDSATKHVLYNSPNVGGKVVSGELARIPLAVSKHTFQNRLNAGDDEAMYLASVVQTIIPRIRADAAGTEGLRINLAELALLDQGASQLKEGHMTAQHAQAFKKRALDFIAQTRQNIAAYKASVGLGKPAEGGAAEGGAPQGDRQAEANAVRAEKDPTKREEMRQAYVAKWHGSK